MEQNENTTSRDPNDPHKYTLQNGWLYATIETDSQIYPELIIDDDGYVRESLDDIEYVGQYEISLPCGPGEGIITWIPSSSAPTEPWNLESLVVAECSPYEETITVSSVPSGVFNEEINVLCGCCAPSTENKTYDFDDLKWQIYESDYIGYYLERGQIELSDIQCHDAVLYCEKTFATIGFEYYKSGLLDDGGGGTVDVTVENVPLNEQDKGGGLYRKGANIVWGYKVQVKAIPDGCHEFDRWEVVSSSTESDQYALSGQGPEAWFIVKPPHRYDAYGQPIYENITYRAVFSQKTFIVYAHVEEGKGRVYVDNKENYAEVGCGNSVRLIAEPGKCQNFIRWEDDLGNVVSVHPEYIELNVDATCDFYAFFEKKKTVGDSLVYDEETGHLVYKCRSLMYGPVCQ